MPFKEEISEAISKALARKSIDASSVFVEPKNARPYNCSINMCARKAYAGGLCNAHYLRKRQGRDMSAPVRARKKEGACKKCGAFCGTKGGWGLCPKHYKSERIAAIKDACVEVFGGKCEKCQNSYHRSVYDFHHIGSKDHDPSRLIANASAQEIGSELSKCIMLCANCHRLEHADNES